MRRKDDLIAQLQQQLTAQKEGLAEYKQREEEQKYSIECLMNELKVGEQMRQQQHNHIQFLKGPMRVYCRVKPLQSSYAIANNSSNQGDSSMTPRKSEN